MLQRNGTLKPFPIPEWKWDKVSMDFITGFPKYQKGNDAIFVVIDRLSKVSHFLLIRKSITASQLADLYVLRVVSLHGVPLEINSDRGSLFTSRFWQSFQNAMGTHLSFSTAFHPQSSGQVERVNHVLEDMLRACVISFGRNWEKSLPFAEFACNNSFQSSLNMAPFEFLYGRRCRTPLNWSETGERQFFGPDMIKEAEDQVRIVRDRLKAAQSHLKSYYDRHHREESYNIDEKAYLRVTPLKGTQRFGIKGKLAPRYIGTFRILAKRGEVAYQLELPLTFSEYMMYSMCHNSGVASRTPSAKSTMKRLISNMTFLIESTPFVFLIQQSVSLAARRLSSSKFNGHTTPRKKLHGKEKIVSEPSTPPSFRRLLNLGTRFF